MRKVLDAPYGPSRNRLPACDTLNRAGFVLSEPIQLSSESLTNVGRKRSHVSSGTLGHAYSSESLTNVGRKRGLKLSDEDFNLVEIRRVEIHLGGRFLPSCSCEVSEAFM